MRSFRRLSISLSLVFVCLGAMSCAPTDTQATRQSLRESGSAGVIAEAKTQRSKEQILAVADAVARERGYFPEAEGHRLYVEENNLWRYASAGTNRVPELEGHDYQVVSYQRLWAAIGGELVVIVDRNTGKVLKVWED